LQDGRTAGLRANGSENPQFCTITMANFRLIPAIDQLRQRGAVRALEAQFGADATVTALREAASAVRSAIAGGDLTLTDDDSVAGRIESTAASRLRAAFRPSLEPVINATGVIIHTNLGRAPLAAAGDRSRRRGRARVCVARVRPRAGGTGTA
jgi:L-seryl-tRNA(Ser) seleniumtransferase